MWTYPGIKERLAALETEAMTPSVYRAIKSLIALIDAELADPDGSVSRLKAYRYRAAKLLRSI